MSRQSIVLGAAALRRFQAEVFVSKPGGTSAPRRPGQEAHLHQIRLAQIFQRHSLLAEGSGQRFQTHRPAVIHLDDGAQQAAVQFVQTQCVHVHPLEAQQRHFLDVYKRQHHPS